MKEKNEFRCANWSTWSETARRVFNETYRTMRDHQKLFRHPKQEALPAQKWGTVAWNAAWVAADAADGLNEAP